MLDTHSRLSAALEERGIDRAVRKNVGALLVHRERAGYRRERTLLGARLAECPDRPATGAWIDEMRPCPSLGGEIAAGLRCRHRFRHRNRLAPMTTPLHRYGARGARVLGKLRRRGKTLPAGLLLAVTDAVGPSVGHASPERLGGVFRIRRRRLGKRGGDGRSVVRALAGGSVVVCVAWRPERRDGMSDGAEASARLPPPDSVPCTASENVDVPPGGPRRIAVDADDRRACVRSESPGGPRGGGTRGRTRE